jgi:carboxymethylenebutenolidase
MAIRTERIEIPVGTGTMGGYLARPDDDTPRPGVVVFMERVAAEGYVVLAPDFFHRTGPGVEYGYDDEGMGKGMALLGQLEADEMIADAQAAVAALRARSDVGDKVGAMGFCIGGHMTYLAACETDVNAAASFYGGGIAAPQGPGGQEPTLGRTSKIGGRILCLFGAEDSLIPSDQVDAIQQSLAAAGTAHDTVVYPGADHGFFCDLGAGEDPVRCRARQLGRLAAGGAALRARRA